jgi:hypothetical protein
MTFDVEVLGAIGRIGCVCARSAEIAQTEIDTVCHGDPRGGT